MRVGSPAVRPDCSVGDTEAAQEGPGDHLTQGSASLSSLGAQSSQSLGQEGPVA